MRIRELFRRKGNCCTDTIITGNRSEKFPCQSTSIAHESLRAPTTSSWLQPFRFSHDFHRLPQLPSQHDSKQTRTASGIAWRRTQSKSPPALAEGLFVLQRALMVRMNRGIPAPISDPSVHPARQSIRNLLATQYLFPPLLGVATKRQSRSSKCWRSPQAIPQSGCGRTLQSASSRRQRPRLPTAPT